MTDKEPDSAIHLISNLWGQLCIKHGINSFCHTSNYQKLLQDKKYQTALSQIASHTPQLNLTSHFTGLSQKEKCVLLSFHFHIIF